MYQENARKLAGEINAINPRLAMEIIGLGRKDSMLKVLDQLEAGAFIGILADRTIEAEEQASCCFLGQTAPFPSGPFRLARILRRPVVMMLGLYGGGCRYDVHFEMLADWSDVSGSETLMTIEQVLHRYVERLEHHVRLAPYNWFNFYDIWK
jgi:predicted LPLAT superfamily acyltransferase